MKVMNQMIVIASFCGLCATAACDRRSPVNPDAAGPAAAAATAAASESSNASVRAQPLVFTAACDINAALADFRTSLGPLNPNDVGERNGGHREVNWDAVPPAFTNTLTFPGDFFNQNFSPRARGVVFSTDGTGLSVSDNDFRFINPEYDAQFNSFSPIRTFSAIGSPESRVDFFVAGTGTPARSTGFGVVFSDVDQLGSAFISLLGVNGSSLGVYQAPPCSEGFSFVGVQFPTPLVAAVVIRSGQGPLGPDASDVSDRDHGPARDLVIMDDFVYGEPRAIR